MRKKNTIGLILVGVLASLSQIATAVSDPLECAQAQTDLAQAQVTGNAGDTLDIDVTVTNPPPANIEPAERVDFLP